MVNQEQRINALFCRKHWLEQRIKDFNSGSLYTTTVEYIADLASREHWRRRNQYVAELIKVEEELENIRILKEIEEESKGNR